MVGAFIRFPTAQFRLFPGPFSIHHGSHNGLKYDSKQKGSVVRLERIMSIWEFGRGPYVTIMMPQISCFGRLFQDTFRAYNIGRTYEIYTAS